MTIIDLNEWKNHWLTNSSQNQPWFYTNISCNFNQNVIWKPKKRLLKLMSKPKKQQNHWNFAFIAIDRNAKHATRMWWRNEPSDWLITDEDHQKIGINKSAALVESSIRIDCQTNKQRSKLSHQGKNCKKRLIWKMLGNKVFCLFLFIFISGVLGEDEPGIFFNLKFH